MFSDSSSGSVCTSEFLLLLFFIFLLFSFIIVSTIDYESFPGSRVSLFSTNRTLQSAASFRGSALIVSSCHWKNACAIVLSFCQGAFDTVYSYYNAFRSRCFLYWVLILLSFLSASMFLWLQSPLLPLLFIERHFTECLQILTLTIHFVISSRLYVLTLQRLRNDVVIVWSLVMSSSSRKVT